ncbi:MAG TPA: YbaY family lipoprotein [Dongiaceae bacterium]|nr:YbaY family lipoprotein [Dongiaceae bacterium]
MRWWIGLVLAALVAVPACKPEPVTVAGTVTYRERMALPADAVMRIGIEDLSAPGSPARPLASTVIKTAGRQVPIPYQITLMDPTTIDPKHEYGLRIRIETHEGVLLFINDTRYGVLTNGVLKQDVVVKHVAAP